MPSNNRSNPGLSSGPPRYPGTFLLAFREALGNLNWQARRWLGDAVACVDSEGEEHLVGLENLYRRARREERESWPALIGDFLTKVREAENARVADVDLAAVADHLMVRFGRPIVNRSTPSPPWWQPVEGTELGVNLVIDQPDTMVYVTEEMIAASAKPGEEWLAKALKNLRGRTPADCLEIVHEESGLRLCSVGDAYDSARALLVEDLLPESAPAGVLVAIPSRDELLILPVEPKALIHLHLMKMLAEKNYQNAPYAISDSVYWSRAGSWQVFPVTIRKDKVEVKPPSEFLDLVSKMTPPDGWEATPPDENDSPDA
jgi:hypothetical protein